MTRSAARKTAAQFWREVKEMSDLEAALDLEEKAKQLPKAVKAIIFLDEMRRVRNMPKPKRKEWMDDFWGMMRKRQAQRN